MIEIGHEPTITSAFRRLSEVMGGMAAIVLLVWLIRGLVGIGNYSEYLLLAGFGFVFLGRVFDTKTNSGAGRAVSSFLWNMTAVSIIVVLLIWFLGWIAGIQSDTTYPVVISDKVPDLVIAAVVTGLGAYAADRLSRGVKRAVASRPPFVVREGSGPSMGEATLSAKHDTVGLPIKRSGLAFGCVLLGDVSATFETPMGVISASLAGPVTTMGIPFEGRKVRDSEVVKMTGKPPRQLMAETQVDPTVRFRRPGWGRHGRAESVDLPFVHIHEDGIEEVVEVGPIKVREGPGGGHVKIGPFEFSDDKPKSYSTWIAKGAGDSYVRRDGYEITAKWNGSSLSLESGSMTLTVGSDSFSYSPFEVKTISPLHTLRVTQDKVSLDTRKFALNISGDRVVLRAEDKTTSTDSKALANDLRALLTETAKSQVKDVMEGAPLDLSEMLSKTEEVLSKHD